MSPYCSTPSLLKLLLVLPPLALLAAHPLAADTTLAAVTVGSLPVELAVSPAGDRVYVSNAGDGTVSMINTSTFAVTRVPIAATGLEGIAVSPDNSKVYIVSLNAGSIRVLNTATLTEEAPIPISSEPIEVVFDPNGASAYVTDLQQGLFIVNTATNAVSALPLHPGARGLAVVNVPNVGKRIYVALAGPSNSEVAVVNPASGAVQYINIAGDPFGIAATPNGKKVYASLSENNATAVIKTATNAVLSTIGDAGGFPVGVAAAATPTGTRIYVADFNGNGFGFDVSRIDSSTDTLVGQDFVGNSPRGVAASADGTRVYVANSGSNSVTVIDTTH